MRAATFQREFCYDFVQWDGPHQIESDPRARGFLFNDDSGVFGHGAIVGACARWREHTDHPPCWAMQWIWIAPKARRRGILSRRWDAFRARFGKFVIEPPLSEAMQAFAAKHGVVDLVVQEDG
jgi:ribosomal protein S18 acetylase RimI-like enzyme